MSYCQTSIIGMGSLTCLLIRRSQGVTLADPSFKNSGDEASPGLASLVGRAVDYSMTVAFRASSKTLQRFKAYYNEYCKLYGEFKAFQRGAGDSKLDVAIELDKRLLDSTAASEKS